MRRAGSLEAITARFLSTSAPPAAEACRTSTKSDTWDGSEVSPSLILRLRDLLPRTESTIIAPVIKTTTALIHNKTSHRFIMGRLDRKSTRLNYSHVAPAYAV